MYKLKDIRMRIFNIFKIFFLGGIPSDIQSEILFYGSIYITVKQNLDRIYDMPPKIKILNTVIP